jgi:hypothetical protein
MYMSGNEGYERYVGQSYYRYYYQQGFQRGYQDGFYSRRRYGNGNEILGNVLNGIFRAIRNYTPPNWSRQSDQRPGPVRSEGPKKKGGPPAAFFFAGEQGSAK